MLIPGALFLFRGKIASILGPYLPSMSPQKMTFYGHLATLVLACAYVIPLELAGLGGVKRPLFTFCMWVTILTSMQTIKANYGLPALPEGMSLSSIKDAMNTKVQPWLQQAMTGPDFPFLFFALIFMTAAPSIAPLVILARRSLWSVCTYSSKSMPENRLWLKFKPTWEGKLKPREAEILLFSATAEIVLGLFLAVSLALPSRQFLVTLLYWNYLTTRYRVPRSQKFHGPAWRQLGQRVEPVLSKLPFLRAPINMAKKFFSGT